MAQQGIGLWSCFRRVRDELDARLARRFDATRSITSPRWLKRRQNQGQLAGSQSDVQRRLRLQPLVCEQPPYSLCTCVTRIRAVLPRTRTGSVGVTSRWQTADVRCSERPLRLQQSRVTSSDRSQRTYIFRMYPYPSYGAAGPVSGGLEGRQGRVQNPYHAHHDTDGKGVKPLLSPQKGSAFPRRSLVSGTPDDGTSRRCQNDKAKRCQGRLDAP